MLMEEYQSGASGVSKVSKVISSGKHSNTFYCEKEIDARMNMFFKITSQANRALLNNESITRIDSFTFEDILYHILKDMLKG